MSKETKEYHINKTLRKKIKDNHIKVSDDFNCPVCKLSHKNRHTKGNPIEAIETTKPLFTGDLAIYGCNPGYAWLEVHKCRTPECNTIYLIENGC